MIAMKAPAEDVTVFSHAGNEYPVRNGVLEVPPEAVRHAVAHGFLLNTSDNAAAQTKYDVEAAIAKALAAVEIKHVAMKCPEDTTATTWEGEQFDADENGVVSVPEAAVSMLTRLGFSKVEVPEEVSDGVKAAVDLVDLAELATKKVPELRAWLKKRNVDVLDPRATKVDLMKMIEDTLKAEAEAKAKAEAEAGA